MCSSRMADVSILTFGLVLLQAMRTEPPPEAKCKDKFLVQSTAITADKEFANIAAIVGLFLSGRSRTLLTFSSGSMWMMSIKDRSKRRRSESFIYQRQATQPFLHHHDME